MTQPADTNAYLSMFDDAWSHPWESLSVVLEGVTEPEACHVAPMYSQARSEAGWPAAGSILWQLAHLSHCKAYYTALIEQRGTDPGNPDPSTAKHPADFAGLHQALKATHAEQRRVLAGLTQEDMELKVGNGMALPEFLSMIIRHDIWHASQIALARRAWSEKSSNVSNA